MNLTIHDSLPINQVTKEAFGVVRMVVIDGIVM